MKPKLIILVTLLGATLLANAAMAQFVQGYMRNNGTYVYPHYRTAPDGNPYNNYRQD